MAIKGQPSISPYWFTPEGQEEPITAFQLKPLTAREGAEVFTEINLSNDGKSTLTFQSNNLAVKYGLIGWRNFCDSSGAEIPFSKENIDRLPPLVFLGIATTVINNTVFSEEEKKT